ncbi:MAG: hypothetical protein LUH82_03750 [Clostridiales bacterium]|nr:hypothetical protein [Clostridiales bacterium]
MTEGFEEFDDVLQDEFGENADDNLELEAQELKVKEKISFIDFFLKNKTLIYAVIFYAAGLFAGAYIYLKCQNDVLDSLISTENSEFVELLLNKLCAYLAISIFTVLLGICLIGFSLVNIMPLLIGVQTGLKIACFYVNYNIKGVGYALIMVAPYVSFFTTVIIYAAISSYKLSKSIWAAAIKHQDLEEGRNYKYYIKKFMLCILLSALAALINSAAITALGGIISI